MPSSTTSTSSRGTRRAAPHGANQNRRNANLSSLSSTASDTSRNHHHHPTYSHPNRSTASSARTTTGPGGIGGREGGGGGGGINAASHETTSLLHGVNAIGGGPSSYEDNDEDFFDLQLTAYRMIYVIQGAFLGLIGPSLSYFSTIAFSQSHLNSPVSSFGPIFAAHGGAALVMSFMSELVLNVAIEMDIMKNIIVGVLFFGGAWYACLPAVAAATGNLGVSIYFIAKGFWVALLNISLNRCCLWVAGDHIELGRSIVTSMNFAYGFGTVLGPIIALVLYELNIELRYAYYGLGVAQVIPTVIIIVLANPRPLYGRDMNQTILGFEDPTRRVPTVPSPIVGGVFLHVKHFGGGSANCNPDTYDSLNNLIILLVTIFATVLFGIQLGLGAFLFDYVGHVLTVAKHPLPSEDIYVWGCMLMGLFWASLWLSYLFFSKFMFHAFNLFSIFHLSIVCMASSFGILFGAETGFTTFVVCLVFFGFAVAPLFTLSVHCLTRVIDELLIRRVSSLIVFGCGMGEVFIPVTMGFFMGNYSGQTYGSEAVSYILFILSLWLVCVSTMLLMMVRRKLRELAAQPTVRILSSLESLDAARGSSKRLAQTGSSYPRTFSETE